MRITFLFVVTLSLFTCSLAVADVVTANAVGFKVVSNVVVDASRDDVWRAAINDVDKWWSSDHTISGNASRLRIESKPKGCFCENLGENAGVVHMTVSMINPTTLLRLTGGLGPLGLMGVQGNMTWEFDDVDDGTRVTFTYAVGGYRDGGLDALAQPVDGVIADALMRLKRYIETGDAEHKDIE